MCTTLMVISTLAVLLRRHFFNKVQPLSEVPDDGSPNGGQYMASEAPDSCT